MHSGSPLLSIIIPAYNCEKYIAKAIQCILNQTFSNFELLIADDGSTDGTRKVIDQFTDTRIRTFYSPVNEGKTKKVNKVFSFAQGRYVTIHDADDYSHLKRFQVQIDFLESNPSYSFCGANFVTLNKEGKIVSESQLDTTPDAVNKLLSGSQFHGPTVVFRKSTLDKLRVVYRPFFKDYNEDYDLCVRAASLSRGINLSEHLYYYRLTEGSLSRELTIQKLCSVRLVQYLANQRLSFGKDDLDDNQTRNLEKMIQEFSVDFLRDPSLLYCKQAERDFYFGFFLKSLKNACWAILRNPGKFRNYRLLQHILRKKIFRF